MYRFSIRSVAVLTLAIAAVIGFIQLSRVKMRLENEVEMNLQEIDRLEVAIQQMLEQEQQEFVGANGDPVIAVYMREPTHKALFTVINCKSQPAPINMWEHAKSGRFVVGANGTPHQFGTPGSLMGMCLRLLRTVEKHDYYRLTFHTGKTLPVNAWDLDGTETTLLIDFDGTARIIIDSANVVAAMGTDRESAIAKLTDAVPDVPKKSFLNGFPKQASWHYISEYRWKQWSKQWTLPELRTTDGEEYNGW